MIVRIVKLTLQPGKKAEFARLFEEVSQAIRDFPGCQAVELLEDTSDDHILFTISKWQTANDLENYRKSVLFNGTWVKVKELFASRAEAWSLESINTKP